MQEKETKLTNGDDELLTRREACVYLHVSQSMLDVHLSIPKVRIGRKVLYKKSTLNHYIDGAETNE
jgi:hypothetical protein